MLQVRALLFLLVISAIVLRKAASSQHWPWSPSPTALGWWALSMASDQPL